VPKSVSSLIANDLFWLFAKRDIDEFFYLSSLILYTILLMY